MRLFADDKKLQTLTAIVCGCKHRQEIRLFPDVLTLVSLCKGMDLEGDSAHYAYQAERMFKWLDRGWLYRDSIATNTLRQYGIWCLTIGFLQGLKTGKGLSTEMGGNVSSLLKRATVRKLLLRSPKATNLEICRVLDKYERLPSRGATWRRIYKEHGTWTRAAGEQSVRTLISQARKAAQAIANYEHLAGVLKSVEDQTGLVKGR